MWWNHVGFLASAHDGWGGGDGEELRRIVQAVPFGFGWSDTVSRRSIAAASLSPVLVAVQPASGGRRGARDVGLVPTGLGQGAQGRAGW